MIVTPAKDNKQIPARNFLQSRFWAGFKSMFGWSSVRLLVQTGNIADREVSILVRRLAGPFVFAYVPHGPEIDGTEEEKQAYLTAFGKASREWFPDSCLFLRFDPAWYTVGQADNPPSRIEFCSPLIKASDVQPPDTVVLDLSCSDEETLARMKPKWRYNIKLAEKKGVHVHQESSVAIDTFYELYRQTAARDRITIHPKAYYEQLFKLAASCQALNGKPARDLQDRSEINTESRPREPLPDLRLWVATHEGQAVASIVTLFYGTTATYLYGASSDEKRNLMPAYALQWAAIKAAKAAGCLEYDMYGIPPTLDEQHPMAGLYRFKTGFGGEIRHYPGAWDYVYLPLWYSVFRAAERIRLFWHKRLRKNQG